MAVYTIGLIAVLFLSLVIPWLSEKMTFAPITKEHLANQELMAKDIRNGVSLGQRERYIQSGRYYIPKEITDSFPIPHRNPNSGKIIIENSKLYYEDARKYGAWQAEQWVSRGKYNLTKEEIINSKIAGFDFRTTHAAIQWERANSLLNTFVDNHPSNKK